MELSDEDITASVDMVFTSFRVSIRDSMLRPSGIVRPAAVNTLLPDGDELKALHAAHSLAKIRGLTLPNKGYHGQWGFMFLCGFQYELTADLKPIFSQSMADFSVLGYDDLSGHQVKVAEDRIIQCLDQATDNQEEVRGHIQMEVVSWTIGKRLGAHMRDGKALNTVFEKEWLGEL